MVTQYTWTSFLIWSLRRRHSVFTAPIFTNTSWKKLSLQFSAYVNFFQMIRNVVFAFLHTWFVGSEVVLVGITTTPNKRVALIQACVVIKPCDSSFAVAFRWGVFTHRLIFWNVKLYKTWRWKRKATEPNAGESGQQLQKSRCTEVQSAVMFRMCRVYQMSPPDRSWNERITVAP